MERQTLHTVEQPTTQVAVVARKSDILARLVVEGYDPGNNGHVPAELVPTKPVVSFKDLSTDKYGMGAALATRDKGPVAVDAVLLEDNETVDAVRNTHPEWYIVALASSPLKANVAVTPLQRRAHDAPTWAEDADSVYILNSNDERDPKRGGVRTRAADRIPKNLATTIIADAEKSNVDHFAFSLRWFDKYRMNPFSRQVPKKGGGFVPFAPGSMEFFYLPKPHEMQRMNEIFAVTDRPTIFIPTCAPDEYVHAGKNTIEYTGKAITGDIAWTVHNNLDALRVLLPELAGKGVKPNLIMGMGDYEFDAGYTRGMTDPQEFKARMNQSADKVAQAVAEIIEHAYGQKPKVETHVNLKGGMNTVTILGGPNLPTVKVTGMMELAGGIDAWHQRLTHARQKVQDTFRTSTGEVANLRARVMANRRDMTTYWLKMKGLPQDAEHYQSEFITDASAYVAFDKMAQELYGETVMVLAGDSRPMELFGARVTNLPLLSVSGMYAGAGFDE